MPRKLTKRDPKAKEYSRRSITLPADLDDRLLAFAQREERSLSFVLAKAAAEYLARHEAKPK